MIVCVQADSRDSASDAAATAAVAPGLRLIKYSSLAIGHPALATSLPHLVER